MLALSPSIDTSRRLALAWGVETRLVPDIREPDQMLDVAGRQARAAGLSADGGRLFILAGVPMGSPGAANVLRMAHLPRRANPPGREATQGAVGNG
jgi:pyruvate kinase